MKHIKTFETVNEGEPQVGDYVICKESMDENLDEFISNNIGKFVRFRVENDPVANIFECIIQYENIPTQLQYGFDCAINLNNCRGMRIDEISKWSKNKKDLDLEIELKKYNL